MKTETIKTPEELWEDGSLLIRDYRNHEQFLMNKGTFFALLKEYANQETIEFAMRLIVFIKMNNITHSNAVWKMSKNNMVDEYMTDQDLLKRFTEYVNNE